MSGLMKDITKSPLSCLNNVFHFFFFFAITAMRQERKKEFREHYSKENGRYFT